jgi:TPR repeat protein
MTTKPVRAATPAESSAPRWPDSPAPRAPVESSAPRAPSAPDASAARALDPEEIAVLLRRGEQLIETGDLSSARLLLRRAAEARDGRAAFALAGTYDPLVLGKLGVYGFTPDVAAARHWYQKAAEFGSREASARLDSLSSTGSR